MIDNRTAEQILKDHGLGNSTVYSVTTPNGYSYSTIDAMEEYASQQTASLREENERLKANNDSLEDRVDGLNNRYADAVTVAEKQHSAIKQLQEEVERLNKELSTIKMWVMSDSVYQLLRLGYKSPSHIDSEDSDYTDLYFLSCELRKALSSKESKPS